MGPLEIFLEGFYYFCIDPIQCLLYINLKLCRSLTVSCLRRRAAGFLPNKLGFPGIRDGKVSLGQVSLEYFGVLRQYESTILTFHPHTAQAIHINVAKYNVVT
jgi:hypothetical protein